MKLVFIVGVPRSGTTLVANRLTSLENSCYLPKSLRVLERIGLGSCFDTAKYMASLSKKLSYIGAGWDKHDGGGQFWSVFESIEDRENRRTMLFSAAYPDTSTNRVFINKRIANVNQLDLLAQTFPEAILMHVKRNPLDTIQSILNRREKLMGSMSKRWGVFVEDMPKQNQDPIVDCALQYRKIYELIENKKTIFSNFLSVQYEEFCADPKKELNSLSTLLGVQSASLDCGGIASRNQKHNADFSKKVIDVLSLTTSDTLLRTAAALKGDCCNA